MIPPVHLCTEGSIEGRDANRLGEMLFSEDARERWQGKKMVFARLGNEFAEDEMWSFFFFLMTPHFGDGILIKTVAIHRTAARRRRQSVNNTLL